MEITVNQTIKVDVDPLVVIEKLIGTHYFNKFDELMIEDDSPLGSSIICTKEVYNYYKALWIIRAYLIRKK